LHHGFNYKWSIILKKTPGWPNFADDGLGTGCDGVPPAGIVTQSNAFPGGTAQNQHKVVAGEQE
jgi:hypothetical protein